MLFTSFQRFAVNQHACCLALISLCQNGSSSSRYIRPACAATAGFPVASCTCRTA